MTWISKVDDTNGSYIAGIRCDVCNKEVKDVDYVPENWYSSEDDEHLCFNCLISEFEILDDENIELKIELRQLKRKINNSNE